MAEKIAAYITILGFVSVLIKVLHPYLRGIYIRAKRYLDELKSEGSGTTDEEKTD